MKIAHLILAHKNPDQLLRLITALQHPAFHFFIHIDKKQDDTPFKNIINKTNVSYINKRAKIHWGDWGTIQATLNGFDEILPQGFDYINVISGQDFPIKSADHIYQYFLANQGAEFITCDRIAGDWSDVAPRIADYHLINWRIPGKFRLGKLLTRILPKRIFPFNYEIVGRANWFSLSKEAVEYAIGFLKENPKMISYFKYCWGADEFIFSTILYNSHFKKNIRDNLVYVDWNGKEIGHPRVLLTQDIDQLKISEKLFARKFDEHVDAAVMAEIEKMIGE